MNTKIRRHHVLGALAAACLAACGGGGNDTASASATPEAAQSPTRAVTVAAATSGSTIIVRARAMLAGGVGATMVVRAEGQILGSVTVNNVGTLQDYSFAAPVVLGAGARVDVVFVNDAVTVVNGVRTEDRNLIVESITVDGRTPIAANADGVVVDKGDGSAAFDGLDTVPGQSGLWWNGALRFVLPASTTPAGHTLTVRASASLAGGVGAQMVVRVDGQVVGNATVGNVGAAQAYSFALAAAPAAGAKVDVAFINDGVTVVNGVRTEDRNLFVESIAVDGGAPIKPTDAGVTLDRGAGQAAYDGVNVIPGQNALAWNGALRFVLPGAGAAASHTVNVRARATLLAGTGANMVVRLDGQVIGQTTVSNLAAQDYLFPTSLPILPGSELDVAFTNNGESATEDRNLLVESITVDGRAPVASTAPGVMFYPMNPDGSFGTSGLPGEVGLRQNGALRFVIDNRPAPATTLKVRAHGVSAGGIAPKFWVLVDGAPYSNSPISVSETSQDYLLTGYIDQSIRQGAQVELVYINAGSVTSGNTTTQRTLVIESVVVGNSVPMTPTTPGVIFDRGASGAAESGDGIDTAPGRAELTENGTLRFSPLELEVAGHAAAGTPVATMSAAQKVAATRMAYEALKAYRAAKSGGFALFERSPLSVDDSPLVPTNTLAPAASVLCAAGGGYTGTQFDWPSANPVLAPLAAGTPLALAGRATMNYAGPCKTAGVSLEGRIDTEYRITAQTRDIGLTATTYQTTAQLLPSGGVTWRELSAPLIPTVNAQAATVIMNGPMVLGTTTDDVGGRSINESGLVTFRGVQVNDGRGSAGTLRGSMAVSHGSDSGVTNKYSPLNLSFDMDGRHFVIKGVYLRRYSIGYLNMEFLVSCEGVRVGRVFAHGTRPAMVEVDGALTPL